MNETGKWSFDCKDSFPGLKTVTVEKRPDLQLFRIAGAALQNGDGLVDASQYGFLPLKNLHDDLGIVVVFFQDMF